MSFKRKRSAILDLGLVGGAGLAFVAGFLPWWSVMHDLTPGLVTVDGWSAGFTAWAGILLLTAAGILVLLRRSGVAWRLAEIGASTQVAAASAAGLVLVIIRWLTMPHGARLGLSTWARYGIYVALIAGIIEVAAAVLQMRIRGESAPAAWRTSHPGSA